MNRLSSRLRAHMTYANIVASLALFVALGGVSYAAVKLPANSVGSSQIKKNAVTLAKIAPSAQAALKGGVGAQGAMGPVGQKGDQGAAGHDGINGLNGVTGLVGLTGSTGATGAAGLPGATGATGLVGDKGDQGDKGATGDAGTPGQDGTPGSNGYSETLVYRNSSVASAESDASASTIAELGLPTGNWLIGFSASADGTVQMNGTCTVEGGDVYPSVHFTVYGSQRESSLAINSAIAVTTPGTVAVKCSMSGGTPGDDYAVFDHIYFTATKVNTLYKYGPG